jgi:hypothetical protein
MNLPSFPNQSATTRAFLFLKQNGWSPLEEYLRTITTHREIAHIHGLIERLITQHGILPRPYAKKVRDKIWELRSPLGNRVFYVVVAGREIILLDGYTKKRDRIEAHVLNRVWNMYQEYELTKHRKAYLPFNPTHSSL